MNDIECMQQLSIFPVLTDMGHQSDSYECHVYESVEDIYLAS